METNDLLVAIARRFRLDKAALTTLKDYEIQLILETFKEIPQENILGALKDLKYGKIKFSLRQKRDYFSRNKKQGQPTL